MPFYSATKEDTGKDGKYPCYYAVHKHLISHNCTIQW
jgi:hypothetical protein